ncbi:MAG: TIM barrel protein [Planctomycetaceae bacterium]|nr:TIM barrel protein [Planctomycetaceae bacterium]
MYSSWYPRGVGLNLAAEEAIEIAAETGFAGVDLQVLDLVQSGTDPVALRRRMDDMGLRGGAWPLPVSWRGEAAQFEADLKRLPSLARAAATLGLFRTGTWVMPQTIAAAEPSSDHHELRLATCALHFERLGKIAGILADWGCRLGLEIMGPATARTGPGVPFVSRYAELKHWFNGLRAQHSNLGVLVDSFHLFAAQEPVGAGFEWGSEAVVWVHLADSAQVDPSTVLDQERELPGMTGWGDSKGLLKYLSERSYNGPVSVEPLNQCRSISGLPPREVARQALTALKRVWPDSPLHTKRGGSCAL